MTRPTDTSVGDRPATPVRTAVLVASGDLRLSANPMYCPAREAMEHPLTAALKAEGVTVTRAHRYDGTDKHGFISGQRMGMDVFKTIDRDTANHALACKSAAFHAMGITVRLSGDVTLG